MDINRTFVTSLTTIVRLLSLTYVISLGDRIKKLLLDRIYFITILELTRVKTLLFFHESLVKHLGERISLRGIHKFI